MLIVTLGLLIASVTLFVIAAFGVPSGRFSLLAGGLACLALAELLLRAGPLGG